MTFFKFIFSPANRKLLLWITAFHILIAILFHWAYPFTIYFHDTPNYFLSAKMKHFYGYRPYGYSGFINFCIGVNQSIYSVVFFQSLAYPIANVLFIFTIEYLFPFNNKKLLIWLAVLISLGGQQFMLTNVLISDSIFISLTLVWMVCILHILKNEKTNYFLIIFYAFVCYGAAKTRYAGLIYPFIGLVVAAILFRKSYMKLFINALVSLILFFFIYKQGVKENKDLCGIETFSAFGGWAKLNNASVIIPEVKGEMPLRKLADIHSFFKLFPDSTYSPSRVLTGQLMWNKLSPEKQYMNKCLLDRPQFGYLPMYVSLGKIYGEYGDALIKNNLSTFITRFYAPNIRNVIFPKYDDITGYLNRPVDESTRKVCATDFDYFVPRNDIYKKYITWWVQIRYFILTLAFILAVVFLHIIKKIKPGPEYKKILYFIYIFFICNSAFLAYAHPITMRYLLTNEFIFATAIFIIIDHLFYPGAIKSKAKK
ncbi:MAG TPA: hypothetical protein VNZ49_00180 [Bacteroidia bacterium]|jgi:hypothetical protein|nr:hypothetical protein [Bacteroidia bacterium]